MSFFDQIWECMNCSNLEQKFTKFRDIKLEDFSFKSGDILSLDRPSYSDFCEVKPMKEMKNPKSDGAFLHSIAHIEYSAIDIALDACYRFRGLPLEYYKDWLEVASDEIRHFDMIAKKMAILGVKYGDMPVHDGLFVALVKTQNSLVERMAVLPRYMEANGLDANLFMMEKLSKNGDKNEILPILQTIHKEEIDHVSKGDRWFKFACKIENIDPNSWINIVRKCYPKAFETNRVLDIKHRKLAGFSDYEIDMMQRLQERR